MLARGWGLPGGKYLFDETKPIDKLICCFGTAAHEESTVCEGAPTNVFVVWVRSEGGRMALVDGLSLRATE